MRPIKNADVPRRHALWVQERIHRIIKIIATITGTSPYGIVAETAIDEYLEKRPETRAVVEGMLKKEGLMKEEGG